MLITYLRQQLTIHNQLEVQSLFYKKYQAVHNQRMQRPEIAKHMDLVFEVVINYSITHTHIMNCVIFPFFAMK